MSDLTPPPDEPMPDQSRARIRADLLAAAQDDGRSGAPRWVVPAVAAVAVLLVAATASWAVQAGGDGVSGGTPASTSTSSTPADVTPSETPSQVPSEKTTTVPDGGHQAGTSSCVDELVNVLKGAEPAAAFPQADGGTTTFWVRGDRFVLCDERAGTTTVHRPLPLTPAQDVETYRVSSLYAPAKSGFTVYRVAGGLVPQGAMAFDVSYTFPDGHVEKATTTVDPEGRTWWRMLTSYHEDSGFNETTLPPIEVTLSLSGVQKTYDLKWGIDTCAQANHGC
jgi:hypothetical protein